MTLEILGDIPDADLAPPDTVLFVAKLNPATQDDDLRLIFSRFGEVVSCDVIRDQKTGQSLQYAFVGFKKKEECEAAFFKMQNVLVDDRRIHVDFSQSVAREWQSFKLQQRTRGKLEKTSASGHYHRTNQPQSYARKQWASQLQELSLTQHSGIPGSRGLQMPEAKQHRDFDRAARHQHQRGVDQQNRARDGSKTEAGRTDPRVSATHASRDRDINRRRRSRSRSIGRR